LKQYCFDTSGLSNPHETMPEHIPAFKALWTGTQDRIIAG
jgi:hypothetical protein